MSRISAPGLIFGEGREDDLCNDIFRNYHRYCLEPCGDNQVNELSQEPRKEKETINRTRKKKESLQLRGNRRLCLRERVVDV